MSKLENKFQADLIKDLKALFPGCVVLKNDSGYQQGIPDLVVFYGPQWAILECKKSSRESLQPNQQYFVDKFNAMSFGAFIYPENREEVLRSSFESLSIHLIDHFVKLNNFSHYHYDIV